MREYEKGELPPSLLTALSFAPSMPRGDRVPTGVQARQGEILAETLYRRCHHASANVAAALQRGIGPVRPPLLSMALRYFREVGEGLGLGC
jgi:hypothetical protein